MHNLAVDVGPEKVPAFYINRACDEDRRQSITAYLDAAQLSAERVPGVEGLDVPARFRNFFFDGEKLDSKLRAGEVGCYASHLVAMDLVVQRNLDYALILEDDATLPVDVNDTLADLLATAPAGWDLIHLCRDSNRAVKIIADLKNDRRLIRFSRVPETTTGYLISRSGAQKFLKPMKRYCPIDTDFRQPWRFRLDIYGVTPSFIRAEGFASAIHGMGDHSRLRRGFPKPSRHCWTGNPLHSPLAIPYNIGRLGVASWLMFLAKNMQGRITRALKVKRATSWLLRHRVKSSSAAKGSIAL